MNDIEHQLREQPLRPLPSDWKAEILDGAISSADTQSHSTRRRLSFSLLFSIVPRPLTVTLAAAWMVIAMLRISTPADFPSSIAGLLADSSTEPNRDQRQDALQVRTMILIAWHEEADFVASASVDIEQETPITPITPMDTEESLLLIP